MGRIPANGLGSPRETGRSVRPLRGRQDQIRHIEMALQEVVENRQSKILLLEGASGSGKTRLLAEADEMAIKNGFSVINGGSGDRGSGNNIVLTLSSVRISNTGIPEGDSTVMVVPSPGKDVRTW